MEIPPAIHVQTDQQHANQVRNVNEGELGVAVTESAKKHKENQDWTSQTHSAYKEENIQLNNKLNTPGIGNAHMRKGDQTDRTQSTLEIHCHSTQSATVLCKEEGIY